MAVKIKLDNKKRILKLCIGRNHWVVASVEYFPLVDNNLAPYCRTCWAQRRVDAEQKVKVG